jgi:starch phosphorylase
LLQARLARQAPPVPPRRVERPAVVAAPPAAASIRVPPTPTHAPKGKRGRLWDPATVERLKVWIADIPKRARPPEVIRVSVIPLSGSYADLRVYRGGFPTRLGLVLHFDLLPDVIEALQDALQRRGSAPDRLAGRGGTRDEWTEPVTGDVDGWATEGTSPGPAVDGRWDIDDEAAALCGCLEPDTLTLGFARRFATYKRPNLLLHDPDRLLRLLSDRERPVQLVMAGKAHPADQAGQDLIKEWIRFVRRPEVRGRVIFLPDYDLLAAEQLVQGVDLWINTPRRPWEASGTSGMKVLVNGGLNLSELDGWWAEAHVPEVGWALGDGREHGADPAWDAAEAEALYGLLEREVVPAFYIRDARGIPVPWIAKMRASMARLTPRFSANRVVHEYTETYYRPLASAYRMRAANGGGLGRDLVAWRRAIAAHWPAARFGALTVEPRGAQQRVTVPVYLGSLDPEAVRVELYANPGNDGQAERHTMERARTLGEGGDGYEYSVTIPSARPFGDYTPRVLPQHPNASVPLEAPEILWHR